MYIRLSKSEILALRQIGQMSIPLSQLADKLGVKLSFISRVVNNLEAKGLVERKNVSVKILDQNSGPSKGIVLLPRAHIQKIISLSMASHAQFFKQISDLRPNAKIEKWMYGWGIDIILAIGEGATVDSILKEAGCSRSTLYRGLKAMQWAGLILWKEGRIEVSDAIVRKFASSYADNLQLVALREVKGHNTAMRVGKNVVFRTDADAVPPFMIQTGLSALVEKGLEAVLTSYDDYYFRLDRAERELSVEECFIHALLLTSLQAHQDTPILTIFYAKNKTRLDLRTLKELAGAYKVESALIEVRGKTEFYEKMEDDAITRTPGVRRQS